MFKFRIFIMKKALFQKLFVSVSKRFGLIFTTTIKNGHDRINWNGSHCYLFLVKVFRLNDTKTYYLLSLTYKEPSLSCLKPELLSHHMMHEKLPMRPNKFSKHKQQESLIPIEHYLLVSSAWTTYPWTKEN